MATGLTQPSPPIKRPPRFLTWIIGIIAVLFIATPMLVGFYTDWLWFGEVDFRGVFTKVIIVRIILFLVFALIAGFIAAYGLVRSKVGGALTGIGIAVSLMPPLVATGIGLLDPKDFSSLQTFLIFLLNFAGILAGSMVVFSTLGFSKIYKRNAD